MPQTNQVPGDHRSLWLATTPRTGYPALQTDLNVDVAIVGGGIAGLTTAHLLKRRGKRVAVIEAGRIVEGVTAHTTAKLTSQHGLIYDYLIRAFDQETAFGYGAANEAAIDLVERIAEDLQIECEFTRAPAYTYVADKKHIGQIDAEVKAAQDLGLPAQRVDTLPVPFPVAAAIRFANQANFHPRKYLLGVAQQIEGDGSYLLEETQALDVKDGSPCQVTTTRGTITAEDVVIATHFPFQDHGLYFARMEPHRSYLLAVALAGPVPEGMYISADASRTLRRHRTAEGRDLLLVGGEGHKTGHGGDTIQHYQHIETWARSHFQVEAVRYSWSTQDFSSFDRIPFIGRTNPTSRHVYVATGFKGWGMSTGTAAGMILSDLLTGYDTPWADVFDPNRLEVAGTTQLVKANLQVAKEFTTGYLGAPRHEVIPPGEARVVEGSDGKLAIYRAADGVQHVVSAVCTHMGCIVRWNTAEKSWDCPCHGSRFRVDGEVIQGPAQKGLEQKIA